MSNFSRAALYALLILFSLPFAANAQVGRFDADAHTPVEYRYRILPTDNWVFWDTTIPTVEFMVSNPGPRSDSKRVRLVVTRDTLTPVYTFAQDVSLNSGDSTRVTFSFNFLESGFYKVSLFDDGSLLGEFERRSTKVVSESVIAYEPQKTPYSRVERPEDFDLFWQMGKGEAQAYPLISTSKKVKGVNGSRNVTTISLKGFGGSEIKGYLAVPKSSGTFPVVISFADFGSQPDVPVEIDDSLKMRIDFVVFSYNSPYRVGNKYECSFRKDYLNGLRALDFILSLGKTDKNRVYLEGYGKGASVALAVAAIDKRVAAVAPYSPSLAIFPFLLRNDEQLCGAILGESASAGMDRETRKVLSYFDITLFAPMVQCPVIYGVGLQNEKVMPRVSFASYAALSNTQDAEYYIFSHCGSTPPKLWESIKWNFYKKHLR